MQVKDLHRSIVVGRVSAYSKQVARYPLHQVIERVEATPKRLPAKTAASARIHRLDRRLSPDTIAELVAAYRSGTSTPKLRKQYQLSKGGVLKLLADHGVTMRNQPLTEEQTDQAVGLYEQGQSLVTIAEQLDSGATAVRTALKARGVVMRPAGGSKPGRG
ncbi:helix-turn-helix domain-containing protein [Nocardia sp. NPDC051052]|uniref:helix-turn-helix domain-containing protein n=1 Tax=Nocardia sp. NPDC051052 TaxID=3364322 RepID=UPI0037B581AF